MSRPVPLNNLDSGRSTAADTHSSLTPRTPHSRMGYAEEGRPSRRSELNQLQPLLVSSGSDSFPQEQTDPGRLTKVLPSRKYGILYYVPLVVGSGVAAMCLVISFMSWKSPGYLLELMGYENATKVLNDTPSMLSHHRVNSSMFISYENYTRFPLLPSEYRGECDKYAGGTMHHAGYWQPMNMGPSDVPHYDTTEDHICANTVTYMLDGHVGLLADLALLAQTAALSREQNRTFLVDDTYWNRGKWLDHFEDVRILQPGPEPGCKPPPLDELVACPRVARHWVVSSRTALYHFGHSFSEQYEDPYARDLNRIKPIFNHATQSFETVIQPNAQNRHLISIMRQEVEEQLRTNSQIQEPFISLHIRRGDVHAMSWKYHGKHLPTSLFVDGARRLWSDFGLRKSNTISSPEFNSHNVYIASDAPESLKDYIKAARPSKAFSLAGSHNPTLQVLASPMGYFQEQFNGYTLEERVRLTRGMVVDFAMISNLWGNEHSLRSEGVVCGLSSTICRMAALGYGWEGAFGLKNGDHEDGSMGDIRRWVEVDNAGTITH